MAHSPFKAYFLKKLLEASDEKNLEAPEFETEDTKPSASPEETAWEDSLDPDTDPNLFDIPDNPFEHNVKEHVELIKDFIQKMEDFLNFINGMHPNSLNAQINRLDRQKSILRGVVRSEGNRIVRIAEDVAGLREVFIHYLLGAEKKIRDFSNQ